MFQHVNLHFREEELQLQKRKKRRVKPNSRLSFSDDIENESDEEAGENSENICFALLF